MADQVQIRRNTTAGLGAFAAAPGELVADTTKNALYLGNGKATPGVPVGVPVSPQYGAFGFFGWCEEAVTLSGASTEFTVSLPASSPLGAQIFTGVVFALASSINTAITGSGGTITGYQIGTAASANAFGSVTGTSSGSGGGAGSPVAVYNGGPAFYITPAGATSFTGGVLHVSALVLFVSPPTA